MVPKIKDLRSKIKLRQTKDLRSTAHSDVVDDGLVVVDLVARLVSPRPKSVAELI